MLCGWIVFDRVWRWTQENLQREDYLFSWRWDARSSPSITDYNNATDGDVLIAWALLKAYQKWGGAAYQQEAEKILGAIRSKLIVSFAGYTMLLPGGMYFIDDRQLTFNLSYSILPAFIVFAEYGNASLWRNLYRDSLHLLQVTRDSSLSIPADWMNLDDTGKLSISNKHDPVSGYDAIRIPLYLAWCGQVEELKLFKNFWQENGGWRTAPSWINVKTNEHADYGPEAGVLAVRSLAYSNGNQELFRRKPIKDYFSASLVMFSLLAQKEQRCSSGRAV